MTRKVDLPTEAQVLTALAELNAAASDGRSPSVVALARHLGLTNTTFWRHFPDIAQDVATRRRTSITPQPRQPSPHHHDELKAQNAKLRRVNRDLTDQLDLAISHIQRLTLENHRLRQELETAAKVTRIPIKRNQ